MVSKNRSTYVVVLNIIYILKLGKCQTYGYKPCVFPFKYGGKLYNYCLKGKGNSPNKFWCATSVDANLKTVKKWDYCTEKCIMNKDCGR